MIFPIWNVICVATLDPRDETAASLAKGVWWKEILIRYLRWGTYILLALIYNATFDVARAKVLEPGWMLYLVARNLTTMVAFYGFWHWYLYEYRPAQLTGRKFNPKFPSESQHKRDRFWTTSGFLISSMFEISVYHLWAAGYVPYYKNFWDYPTWSILHMAYIGYWRDGQFYFIHRMMHPYGWKRFDLGQFLYKHVHYLHHKSYNTGPWSGLAMHPFEHLVYYSCTLIMFIFTLHPLHFLFNKLHADVSPLPGHDGFDKPGGGSHYHYLHHAHFDCNYGTPLVPFDNLFGSYEDGSKWETKQQQDKDPSKISDKNT